MLNRARLARGVVITFLLVHPRASSADPPTLSEPHSTLQQGSQCLGVNPAQLRVDGARVKLQDCVDRPDQLWSFEAERIVNVASQRCLDVHEPDVGGNGARVQVSKCQGGANQRWGFDRGKLVVRADARCLEARADDAEVQTWDCRRGARQQWERYSVAPGARARDIEAGPIWNQADAEQKCPEVCKATKWTGAWRTTEPGRMSVCNCEIDGQRSEPRSHGGHAPATARQAMSDARFDALLAAMNEAAFSHDRLSVLESASRDNYFVVAQLQRILEGMSFPDDKLHAVEIVAPRILDRENSFTLSSAFGFGFDSYKEQVREIFERIE